MKLRNKKNGKIVDFGYLQTDHIASLVLTTYENGCPEMSCYNSLAEVNAEWEDYVETKDHWHIGCEGDVFIDNTESCLKSYSSIGNDFDTKEEAEKEVEKLKAWKRLKDKGFSLDAVVDTFFCLDIFMEGESYEAIKNDLEIVFGGEE